MPTMPHSPDPINPQSVAPRHLYVLCDDDGVAWGFGTTPEIAAANAVDSFGDLGDDFGGFVMDLLIPAGVSIAALRQVRNALQVIA